MNEMELQARATIAAALINSRAFDAEGLASSNKDISSKKLAHLCDLTERVFRALAQSAVNSV
jgi:hypothetical protein